MLYSYYVLTVLTYLLFLILVLLEKQTDTKDESRWVHWVGMCVWGGVSWLDQVKSVSIDILFPVPPNGMLASKV